MLRLWRWSMALKDCPFAITVMRPLYEKGRLGRMCLLPPWFAATALQSDWHHITPCHVANFANFACMFEHTSSKQSEAECLCGHSILPVVICKTTNKNFCLVVECLCCPAVWELPFAGPSQNCQPLLQELPIFTNPAVCITSLEAAVRHNWDASTAPGADSTGLKLAAAILVALGHLTKEMPQSSSSSSSSSSSGAMLLHERRPLLQYATDTSKSPALLSLLLSCTKQLQYSCRQNPHGALRMAGLSRAVADIAMDVFQLCTEPALTISSTGPVQGTRDMAHTSSNAEAPAASSSSVSGNSTSVTKALCNSRLSPTAGQADSIHPELPAAATAPSIGQAGRPQAGEGTRTLPSTWLVLFGRALYTAGAALQAVAAGAAGTAPTTDTRSMFKVGSLHTPAPATSLLRTFQRYTSLVCVYMKADTSAIAITRKSLGKVQPAAAAVDPILQAYRTLAAALAAAAQLTEELEAAAAAATSSSTGDSLLEWLAGETGGQPEALGLIAMRQTASSSMGIWRQILGDEQGQQLPQAMMDAGSLLCATLPSRSCCNEPSCCCLDKPSELQLAGGKGTKCSGCGVARYCSTVHQKLHWKQHRPACRAIAAAETAANAST